MVNKPSEDNPPANEDQLPAKRVRTSVEPISQGDIDEVNELYDRLKRNVLLTVRNMVKLGEKLCAIKSRLGHGQWGPWAHRNLHFSIRHATRAMKTYHRFKVDPTLLDDPQEFM